MEETHCALAPLSSSTQKVHHTTLASKLSTMDMMSKIENINNQVNWRKKGGRGGRGGRKQGQTAVCYTQTVVSRKVPTFLNHTTARAHSALESIPAAQPTTEKRNYLPICLSDGFRCTAPTLSLVGQLA